MTVSVSDGVSSDETDVFVEVQHINNNGPIFQQRMYQIDIKEDVEATDVFPKEIIQVKPKNLSLCCEKATQNSPAEVCTLVEVSLVSLVIHIAI